MQNPISFSCSIARLDKSGEVDEIYNEIQPRFSGDAAVQARQLSMCCIGYIQDLQQDAFKPVANKTLAGGPNAFPGNRIIVSSVHEKGPPGR